MVKKINCPLACEVPDEVELSEVPAPRHNWGDVITCPNGEAEGLDAPCGRTFMIREAE